MNPLSPFFTTKDLCEIFHCTSRTIQNMRKNNADFPKVCQGGRPNKYLKRDVYNYLNKITKAA